MNIIFIPMDMRGTVAVSYFVKDPAGWSVAN